MRSFWIGSALSLALGFGLSALMYLMLTSSQVGSCEINGVPCSETTMLDLVWFCGMPAAAFSFVVLLGIRIKRHSPRVATWLVSLPPVILLAYAAITASTMPWGG
jgi:hypothetical protein